MRHNPFGNVYNKANLGTNREKAKKVPEFPYLLDIELTNQCNLSCKMCPTGLGKVERKTGLMASKTVRKIVNEVMLHNTPVRFVRWGEPMLHPQLLQYIGWFKRIGSLCHINTNGFYFDREFVADIRAIPLDSIKISFQGLNRTEYKKWRGVDGFDRLVDNIRYLYSYRGKKPKPYIHIGTTVAKRDPPREMAFKAEMLKICDKVTIDDTHNVFRKVDYRKRSPHCPEIFSKMSINWDGTVTACCGDWDNMLYIGDIYEQKLIDIWNGPRLKEIRKKVLDNSLSTLELCRKCNA